VTQAHLPVLQSIFESKPIHPLTISTSIAVAGFRRCEIAVHVALGAELAMVAAAGVDSAQGVGVDVGVNLRQLAARQASGSKFIFDYFCLSSFTLILRLTILGIDARTDFPCPERSSSRSRS
jgi:hypothetical protein